MEKVHFFVSDKEKYILQSIHANYAKILNTLSEFPLSFCHGDCKSPNIFYNGNSAK